jgi:hypothetical protein
MGNSALKIGIFLLLLWMPWYSFAQSDSVFYSVKEALQAGDRASVLILKKQKLTNFPMEILGLKNLKKLDVSKNKITEIPKEIAQLTHLQELKVYRNKIVALPGEIGDLTQLIYLDAHHNVIKEIPATIGKLHHLQYVDLEHNLIVTLPDEIGNCEELQFINVRDTGIDADEEKRLRKILPANCVKLFPPRCQCN